MNKKNKLETRKKLVKKDGLYYPNESFKKEGNINDSAIYKKALKSPVKFWGNLANDLTWQKKWDTTFLHKPPFFSWFKGGKINITENILDRNLEKNGDKIALIWQPEPENEKEITLTYKELYERVNKTANALKKLGVKKGDRVGIYLPMIIEAPIVMLACLRIGAVHSVVFSAFSSNALNVRLIDTNAKVLITADGYYRRGKVVDLKKSADEAIKGTKVKKVIIVDRAKNEINLKKGRDYIFSKLIEKEKDICIPAKINSEDLLFILYTSGSTGKPKGIMHTSGGYSVQTNFTGKWIFNFKEGDIFWSMADIGWITGHTYTLYSPFMSGITTILYEGSPDYPTIERWLKIIEKYKVNIFYTSPTAVRMFEKFGSKEIKKYKLESLRVLGSVGEPIDNSAWNWFFKEVGKEKCPIVDTWWQTETGGILISSLSTLGPFKPIFSGMPLPGIKLDILNEKGKSCKAEEKGNLVILPPFSPGLLRGVYKDEKKYKETYFKEYGDKIYFTSDKALKDKNGLIRVIGRADDTIKVAGHRITTGELENVISKNKDIIECAVIGIPDEIKGEVPVAFIVLKNQRESEEIKKEVVLQVRKEIGPIATPKDIYIVEDLPKTRSGKIMRRIIRNLFSNNELGDLSTLANPESVEKIKNILKKI